MVVDVTVLFGAVCPCVYSFGVWCFDNLLAKMTTTRGLVAAFHSWCGGFFFSLAVMSGSGASCAGTLTESLEMDVTDPLYVFSDLWWSAWSQAQAENQNSFLFDICLMV